MHHQQLILRGLLRQLRKNEKETKTVRQTTKEIMARPKGAKNKRTQEIQDRLAELDCDPIEGMVQIAKDPTSSQELRLQAFKELAQYTAPKRKAVDMTASVDGNISIDIIKFSDTDEADSTS